MGPSRHAGHQIANGAKDESMRRSLWVGLIVGVSLGVGISSTLRPPEAAAQKAQDDRWDYKVGIFTYNPGERLTDERRAALYERTLTQHAGQGWEPVGSLLTRDTVQTVGGAITTRETISFVAYRRRR
jgi:hypothetical protein